MALEKDEEFENFMRKVEDIGSIIEGMRSKDPNIAEKANRRAEIYLNSEKERNFDPEICDVKVKTNKTIINKKAFEMMGETSRNEMSKEVFMAQMEKDVKRRQEDKKQRKEISDYYKRKGNEAFRKQEYEVALNFYNKAIDEIRDSCVLYTNRALTCIKLGLYLRALDDCEWALKVNNNSLKAWLYRAQAHFFLNDHEKAEECIQEACSRHPEQQKFIQDCKNEWVK